ncbi:hypothetical protein F5Y15DRAFT_363369 [Xylariaceae sp. FL0016]|nr:hypothetical protein F5Y15DRAFT_363369 [Xylariaceae sp. FL0016]
MPCVVIFVWEIAGYCIRQLVLRVSSTAVYDSSLSLFSCFDGRATSHFILPLPARHLIAVDSRTVVSPVLLCLIRLVTLYIAAGCIIAPIGVLLGPLEPQSQMHRMLPHEAGVTDVLLPGICVDWLNTIFGFHVGGRLGAGTYICCSEISMPA